MSNPPKLSPIERTILSMLVEYGEMYGLQMVKQSGGALKRGTIYVMLGRMEEPKGLVESRQEEKTPAAIGLPRRLYKVTATGIRALQGVPAVGPEGLLAEGTT